MEERNYYLLEKALSNAGVEGLDSIEAIKEIALQRLKLIRDITDEEMKCTIEDRVINYEELVKRSNLGIRADKNTWKTFITKETISHFLCKIAFAINMDQGNEEERQQFVKAESKILINKLQLKNDMIRYLFPPEVLKISSVSVEMFQDAQDKIFSVFNYNNYPTYSYSSEEKDKLKAEFDIENGAIGNIKRTNLMMFRFYDHSNLLRNPEMVLHKGYIIMRNSNRNQVIQNIFEERIKNEMKTIREKYMNNNCKLEDERLGFLQGLLKIELNDATTQFSNSTISAAEVDRLAKSDMPACMHYLVEGLNKNNHLKHLGRLQLGLFLKGAGLNLHEALVFWQQKFSRIPADDFRKKYEYNIKHNYGKLGKQADYTPMGCQKILKYQPLNEEFHGCPYQTLDNKKLESFLKLHYGIKDEDITEILQMKKIKQYQMSCRKVFEIRNKQKDHFDEALAKVGYHPNIYFEQSLRLRDPKRFAEADEKKKAKEASRQGYQKTPSKPNTLDFEK